jgi:carbon-monoxide dehydrogenase large subunit
MGQFGTRRDAFRGPPPLRARAASRGRDSPGQTHAVIVRSMHAHARIRAIDTAAAARAPGVLAVFTGADLPATDWAPCR